MTAARLGPLLHAFFVEHLTGQKGLRPSSVRSYRDAVRLLLEFVASDKRCKLSGIELEDLTFDRVQRFLRHLEEGRGNRVPTRNQRLAALHTFFEYLCSRAPEIFAVCQQIAAIPTKRTPPPATQFMERDEIAALFARLPSAGRHAMRDRALLLFLYNTGARVQEAADLRVEHLDFERGPRARLHGKGGKWRTCPLWDETARLLQQLVGESPAAQAPVFCSSAGKPLTRFGIYKLVRRHTARLHDGGSARRIGPHVFRHTTAVHLLEAGVEVNVIRGWLGHVNLATTNRYADINIRTKEAALRQCAPPPGVGGPKARAPVWRNDETMLAWLASL
ncbi:MAG: tyrosine-type recombinase/integrase [Polyangiaceae bacterium]|jgi:site-specific recombinase XerD